MSTSSTPAYRPASAEILTTEAPASIAMTPGSGAAAVPLDFLLITSRIDFGATCRRFLEDSARAGLNVEIIYIEDLAGVHNGDRLDQLLTQNAKWQASQKITGATIKLALLHGGTAELQPDPGMDEFRRKYLHTEREVSASSSEIADNTSRKTPVHVMTAAADSMMFPTELIDAALRTVGADGAHGPAGFLGTIVFGSCESGQYRQSARETGGDYVFGIGKKSGYLDDFEAGLFSILSSAAERKRQGAEPLSGRDCWMLLRNISGEHVSFVGDGKLEVSKLLQSGHSEPVLTVAGSGINAQAIRILFAKIKHGSAASVRKVIDRWGPEILSADHAAVMPRISLFQEAFASPRESEQKVRLLMDNLPGFLVNESLVLKCVKASIDKKSIAILAELFGRLAKPVPPPLALESFVLWLKSVPDTQNELNKICRGSALLSDALGLYVLRAMEDEAKNSAPRLVVIPEFLANLAGRMHRKNQQRGQH